MGLSQPSTSYPRAGSTLSPLALTAVPYKFNIRGFILRTYGDVLGCFFQGKMIFAMLRPSHETNAGDVGFTNTSLTMTKSKLNRVTKKPWMMKSDEVRFIFRAHLPSASFYSMTSRSPTEECGNNALHTNGETFTRSPFIHYSNTSNDAHSDFSLGRG